MCAPGVLCCAIVFVGTAIFTAALPLLLTDHEYGDFQQSLITQPKAGDVIPGTGGLRKVRWTAGGKGKSGGVRVIYYFVDEADQIRLLLIYREGIQGDLTTDQKKQLVAIKVRWK